MPRWTWMLLLGLLLLPACGKKEEPIKPEPEAVRPADPPALQEKAKDLIVGRWQSLSTDPRDQGTIVEFQKDGSVALTVGTLALRGKYRFSDENTMDVDLYPPSSDTKVPRQMVHIVKVTKKELVTRDVNELETSYKRLN